jgi:hypothetical protein
LESFNENTLKMSRQQTLFELPVRPSDVVYTPDGVAAGIVDFLAPTGTCLDPCRGEGAFYNFLPEESRDFCELSEGLDFLNYTEKVDWIIGNPPYSIFEEFLEHAFKLADNVAFLVPTNKIFQRQVIMDMINRWGGVRSILIYGSGQLIDFPFGFSVGCFHFQKNWEGETRVVMGINKIFRKK